MSVLSDLQVFITHPHSCSYIEGQQATTLFVDPEAQVDSLAYQQLTELGFRRSGNHIYRPHCESCRACIAARVPVEQFSRKRSQQKIWNRNKDLQVTEVQDIDTDTHYALFERYINQRHRDGDMYPPSREQYSSFLCDGIDRHHFYCFYKDQQLLSVAVTDVLDNALSAIYTFFEPEQHKRSLGVYGILWQIEQARLLKLKHLYLGYWIKDCQKMNYKTQYRPLELYINRQWLSLG